ncbi:DUF4129 domain-containing protein [Mycolicibacterium frederiksbergense]|uniref:DUF4129 domain-containing protein n=1 Tax=Mycolicibacterium frederiksbergense TaxID=117567 RepID=A0A6H0S815_9MYCO|nr:DUF4129 domain-containing protein [Mycolicibacterium frederiksbergense]QIV82485.1 DUF4129 domain-containing protein [Mycolicibacterium frederiksbergense]
MTGINIDGDAAHDAAQRELGKPIYPRPSLTEQLLAWLDEILYKVFTNGSWLPGGWITLALLLTVIAVAVFVAIRIARRTMRTNRGSARSLFGGHDLSAAQHRAEAERCAAQGDWALAIRHRLRAVARGLEETGFLDAVPGRTATELAHDAAAARPDLEAEFGYAADTFNGVSYGAQQGTETGYRQIAALDRELLRAGTP